jgi:hypothetical protein
MKDTLHLRRAIAILVSSAVLAGTAAALVPVAASAHAAKSCGSASIAIKHTGGKPVTEPVSRISVEGGATCAEALKVIRGALAKNPPRGWAVSNANFKVPTGLNAMVAVNGHKRVKYALVGA